jgi:hypothetical protein
MKRYYSRFHLGPGYSSIFQPGCTIWRPVSKETARRFPRSKSRREFKRYTSFNGRDNDQLWKDDNIREWSHE